MSAKTTTTESVRGRERERFLGDVDDDVRQIIDAKIIIMMMIMRDMRASEQAWRVFWRRQRCCGGGILVYELREGPTRHDIVKHHVVYQNVTWSKLTEVISVHSSYIVHLNIGRNQ